MIDYPRTKYEAQLDVKYGAFWHSLHEKLYDRIDLFCNVLSLIVAIVLVFSISKSNHHVLMVCLFLMAAIILVHRFVNAQEKKVTHRYLADSFSVLAQQSDNLSLDDIDFRLSGLKYAYLQGVAGLNNVAHNKNMQDSYREDRLLPLSLWSRFLSLIVR